MLLHIRTTWDKCLNVYFLAPGSEMLTRSIGVETYTAVFITHCIFFLMCIICGPHLETQLRVIDVYAYTCLGFSGGSVVKKPPANAGDTGLIPWVGEITWRWKWQLTSVFLPRKSHEHRSLAGYSPWVRKRVRHDLGTKQQNTCIEFILFIFGLLKQGLFSIQHKKYHKKAYLSLPNPTSMPDFHYYQNGGRIDCQSQMINLHY